MCVRLLTGRESSNDAEDSRVDLCLYLRQEKKQEEEDGDRGDPQSGG